MRCIVMCCCTVILLFTVRAVAFAQQKPAIGFTGTSLSKVFSQVESVYGVKFFYTSGPWIGREITLDTRPRSLPELLDALTQSTGLHFRRSGSMIGVQRTPDASANRPAKDTTFIAAGRITDHSGQPLPGVTVRNQRNNQGTTSGADGAFSIAAISGDPLYFSFIGYKAAHATADRQLPLQVTLEETATSLHDVVVMGYSVKQTGEITGSVQKITGEQLRNNVSNPNVLSMLKGKTTGMYIVENSASAGARGQVLMRGVSSLPTTTSAYFGPLIVIDGVITNATNLQDVVNPADVESITVLKDAASTAIYGSRAAQGVIVITTRNGKQNEGWRVNVDTRYGAIKPNRKIRMMNTTEVIQTMDQLMRRRWEETPALQTQFASADEFIRQRRIYTDEDKNRSFDWEKAMFDDGRFSDVNIGVTNGTANTKMYLGVDWYKENGINYKNTYDRKNARLNIEQRLIPGLTLGVNASVIADKTITPNNVPALYSTQPFVTPYNADGSLADSIPVKQSNNFGVPYHTWGQNFLAEKAYDNTTIANMQNYMGTARIKYDILPWLSIQTTNSLNYVNTHSNSYMDPRSFSGKYGGLPYLFDPGQALPNGILTIRDTRFTSFISSNVITANRSFRLHRVGVLAGVEWSKRQTEFSEVEGHDLLPGERNMGAVKALGSAVDVAYNEPYRPSGSFNERAGFSAFGELNYNWNSKYYASASLRTDAFTNFGRNRRYGTFYAVSAAWQLNRENFLKEVSAIDVLKLRVVHGTSGRDVGDGYLNRTLYADTRAYNRADNFGSTITQLENPDIRWETTVNNTIGLDLGLWKRIELTADLYAKESRDLLQQVYIGSAQGSFQQYQNVGRIINKGVELMLNTHNISSKNFNWRTSVNISFNKNQIRELYGDSLLDNFSMNYYRYKGEDINTIKAIRFRGINPDNGAPLFENFDKNGNIVITEGIGDFTNLRNFQAIGTSTPKFFGGFTNTFSYKQFTLSIECWFQVGNYVTMDLINNFQDPGAPFLGRNNANWQPNQRIWKGPGDKNANYPDVYSVNMDQQWRAFEYSSSMLYGNASHLRVRNIRLGYDFPPAWLKRIRARQANIYISMDNVALLKDKNFVGADPEGASIETSTRFSGVGIGNANPRRMVAGINITF